MEELKKRFPDNIDYAIAYDTTPFINESVKEVWVTLGIAIALVSIVVLVFLQNWRSALIPLIAVPVAIVGTFAVMAMIGFSLNNLTLFGLVLAIGIVVDDAIVVVEAVEHHVEHGMAPRDATIKAMDEVSGPVIAIALVLSAVFVPCAFITGIVGQFFLQFALTIATSTIISAFNSLTLSPALAAILIRPKSADKREALPRAFYPLAAGIAIYFLLGPWITTKLQTIPAYEATSYGQLSKNVEGWINLPALGLALLAFPITWALGWLIDRALVWFFGVFNASFQALTDGYTRIVGSMLKGSVIVLVLYGGLLYLTYFVFDRTPTGFIPSQDKGYLLVNVQMPDSTSLEKTQAVMRRVEKIALKSDGVKHTVAIAGQSILLSANAPNFGAMYVMLDDFHHRNGHDLGGEAISARLRAELQQEIIDGQVNVFGAPPVEGLGTAGGFKVVIEDRGDSPASVLQDAAEKAVVQGNNTDDKLNGLFTSYRANTPWLYLNIDRDKVNAMGVSMDEVFNTLQVYLGSLYVNDFNKFGRTWQVNVQGDADYRKQISDLQLLKIRNRSGGMAPFGAMASIEDRPGPVLIMRYNMYPSAAINGTPGPGTSSGQALDMVEDMIKPDLSPSMRVEWTELALLQRQTGNTAMVVFGLAVVLVFLVLAAQYESWSLPFSVIMVVPMCLFCSVVGLQLYAMDINIFTQIGFIVLVGLACKNAILIVEFAKARHEEGVSAYQATLDACKLRLRPIMMTSLAFILGVVPLVVSEGAGAEMRQALGTAVFFGMLGVTIFGIFLTPVFYFVIQWLNDKLAARTKVRPSLPPPSLQHQEVEPSDKQVVLAKPEAAQPSLSPA